ncbi:ABC transporter substrate-binding protein [Clostridium vincentii]|uniref:Spermidine/putrescine-binding periplasmic protein n=1 Tax=Clostridium vincentii TaxID=52704 RepID=A0A2T0BJ22_9CLOT|nr:spermidine/putrescine ABC transporter substrate-binding protein [Clostridium vincentii]PRR83889.1 Spermidine/putrescine-binding periplasmic protein precursor [Clostridium vincentii]
MKKLNRFLALALANILSVALLVSCGQDAGDSKIINVFNYGDYIDEDLISNFEEETGFKIQYSTYDTNEKMYSKIKSGSNSYDLVFPSDYMIEKMIAEDMAERINFDNIPNYQYIDEDYKNLDYDPYNKYSVPYMWGTIGIIYNPEVITSPVTSWDILWDETYSKDIVMFESVRETMSIGLKKLGYSMNSTDPDEIRQAADLLIEQKPLVKAWFVDQVKDCMIEDGASIATVWSGDAAYIMAENPKLKYVVPIEGSNKWFDSMVIPKSCTNKEGAEAFINFLTDPENSKQNVDYIGYYTPNSETFEMLDDQVKETYPSDEILDDCEVYRSLPNDTLKFYNDEWIRIKS